MVVKSAFLVSFVNLYAHLKQFELLGSVPEDERIVIMLKKLEVEINMLRCIYWGIAKRFAQRRQYSYRKNTPLQATPEKNGK